MIFQDPTLLIPFFVSVALIALLSATLIMRTQAQNKKRAYQRGQELGLTKEQLALHKERSNAISGFTARYAESDSGQTLAQELKQAQIAYNGVPITPFDFQFVRLIFTVALGYFFWKLLGLILPLAIPITAILSYYLPKWFIQYRKNRTIKLFDAQLVEATLDLASVMRSGLSVPQAITHTARKLPSPSREQFLQLDYEINTLSHPIDDAFQNMLDRLPSQNLRIVVTTVLIQRQSGGNLVAALGNLAETMQTRIQLQEELHSMLAGMVLTGRLVVLMPLVILLVLKQIIPGFLTTLISSTMGIVILSASMIGLLIGALLIQRIAKVEV